MSWKTMLRGASCDAARRRFGALAVFAALLLLALAGQAQATEGLLPNLVADPPNNVSFETSLNEGGLSGTTTTPELLLRFNGYVHNVGPGALDYRGSREAPKVSKAVEEEVERHREKEEPLPQKTEEELAKPPMNVFQRLFTTNAGNPEESVKYLERPHEDVSSSAEVFYVSADGHHHWHLQRVAKYSLWNAAKSAEVAPAQKVGFCLEDSEHVETGVGPSKPVYADNIAPFRDFCQQYRPNATSVYEGISPGWRDRYTSDLGFQWVDASNVLPGEYWLREDVNPTGVIKETGGANVPAYATTPTIVPGFDALAQSASTQPGEARTVTLTSKAWNDTATPRYKIVSPPQHGTLGAVSSNQVTYTPTSGYSGPDSFTFSAADPNSEFPRSPAVATVSMEVVAGARALLAGDATSSYAVGDQTTSGREEAFAFTAKSSGTVEELLFRTNGTANTGLTGLTLGIFADNAGKPGEVLGHATVSGQPPTSSWIKATGLSTAVVSGTKYWLVALPLGASSTKLHFNAAVASGGTGNVETTAGGLSAMTAETSWETYNQGPAGFQALGTTGAPAPSVTIEGAPASMTVGTSVQLTAHVTNDSPTVTWKASAGSITTGGSYTAPAEVPAGGTAVVTATTSKGAQDQRTIQIVASPPPSVTIEGAPASMTVGTSVQLTAHVTNDSPTVTWKASAGSITTGGSYTAPAEVPAGGTAVVTATTSKGAQDQRTIQIVAASSKGLLAGDATATYAVGDQTTSGREEAFAFTAKSSGTVEELLFRTNGTANTGLTGLTLGIFADSAGKPGEVLGHATVSGQPATSSWIKATGLSTAVVSGTKYWLVALPLGASSTKLHFNAAVASGGTGNVETTAGGLSAMTAETSWETYNQGPAGFQALGTISGAASPVMATAASRLPTHPRLRPARSARPRTRVMIEGAPSSVIAGTSVQLSALVARGGSRIRWRASGGSITPGGLYTAPSRPPSDGTVLVRASAAGARDQRRITIVPTASPQSAPAVPLSSALGGALGAPASSAQPLLAPQALLIAGKLVMTTRLGAAGQASLTAYLGSRRLGGCAVQTPANRTFSCRLDVVRASRHAAIIVVARLRIGHRVLQSVRPAAPVAGMSMPSIAGVSWLGNASAATAQFICSPALRATGPSSAIS